MCTYLQPAVNGKYKKTIKNGGVIPSVKDYRTLYIQRECGNCKECRLKRARNWLVRLSEELKRSQKGYMVTLTFSNQNYARLYKITPKEKLSRDKEKIIELTPYEIDNEIATIAVKRFRERYRKKFKKSPRHWLVTELGHQNTENIHLHGIIWTDQDIEEIRTLWKYGYIYPRPDEVKFNYLNIKTAKYSIKYVQKMDLQHKLYKSIVLTSPGIGSNYINDVTRERHKYNGSETVLTYITESGHEMALPKYYINKLYTEEQREQLWMFNEDKLTRYVGKEKIDIQKNLKTYWNILKHHRNLSVELGYGTNIPNAKRRKYEHERRKILQAARLK